MAAWVFVTLSVFGTVFAIADFVICMLVEDPNTHTGRAIAEVFDTIQIAIHACIVVMMCAGTTLGAWGKLAIYLAIGVAVEFAGLSTYSIFNGIWAQGQTEYVDFYKQVALMVLAYSAARGVMLVGYLVWLLCSVGETATEQQKVQTRGVYQLVRVVP